ncbi:MAG: LOG family protein [Phycisphaerae bacterium]|nr:LOG family protein [Phycisphaerae bacterium]
MFESEKVITVFGSNGAETGSGSFDIAYRVGKAVAKEGFAVANGGYGGTMLATAKGAKDAGGRTIGVTCSVWKSKANEYIDDVIVTNSLDERLDKLIELGSGYIVLAGGTGTLLELAKVWELKNKGFSTAEKPIILVGEFWKPLVEVVAGEQPESRKYIEMVEKPEDLIERLK